MEDPWAVPPPGVWSMTVADRDRAPRPRRSRFERGRAGRGRRRGAAAASSSSTELNAVVGAYGWGRIDMVENRRVGIKSRETYECPAALALILAHADLESITPRARPRPREGPPRAPLRRAGLRRAVVLARCKQALDAFVDESQRYVTGEVRLRLEPGSCDVTGRRSPHSLYDYGLATYDADDTLPPRGLAPASSASGACRLETWARQAPRAEGRARVTRRPRRSRLRRSGTAGSRTGRPTSCWRSPSACRSTGASPRDDLAGSRAHVRGWSAGELLDGDEAAAVLAALDQVEAELADGHLRVRAVRRGHPHRGRAPGHRARRARRGQAPHRPQPQRPGRHRPAPVRQAGAGAWSPDGSSPSSRSCSTGPTRPATPTCPGYTHLQRAQPVLLAHHLLAHGWALARDVDRLLDCRRRARRVAARRRARWPGSSLPLDPDGVAADLGFAAAFENSLDAVSDRDFVAEALFVARARSACTCRRIGEEIVLWSSEEFGFCRLADAYATGSLDAAAEEEPRHRRAGPGQGRAASSATSPASSPR